MVKILIGAIMVIITSLISTFYIKGREIKITARNSAYQIFIIFALQRSSLTNIGVLLKEIADSKSHRKSMIYPCPLELKDEMVYKLLAYPEFYRSTHAAGTIQKIISAQRVYQDLYAWLEKYNGSLSSENSLKIHTLDPNDPVRCMLEQETAYYLSGVQQKYQEAISMNESARASCESICCELFTERAGVCAKIHDFYNLTFGTLFKPHNFKAPLVEDKTIKALEI